ncbi:MAG: HAD hydrolase-like protein [Candidatus Binataceae bacterium]|nr:HAD hydrolase-like protein [Candidatus Binataceae bacterium]
MARIENILFDLDGTLTDPGSGIVGTVRQVIAELGVEPPPAAELRWCMGPPLIEVFTRLLVPAGKGELAPQAASLYMQRYAAAGAAQSTPYAGVEAMLEGLRGKARMYVATNKNGAIAERIIVACLGARALGRYFEEVVGNARFEDKSDAVRGLIERARMDAAATVIVGDREHDVLAGKRCGIGTVGVTYGYGSREELVAAGADYIADDPAAVARYLLGRI